MCVDACVLQSWGPKWAFRMLDRRKPHSSPLFYLSLTKIAILSSWVRSVDEYVGSGNVRELLANNSSSTYRDGLAYCWDAFSIWLRSHVKAAIDWGYNYFLSGLPKPFELVALGFLASIVLSTEVGIAFITYSLLAFFPSFPTKLEIVHRH